MNIVTDNFTLLLFALVVMWILQFGLSYFQMRRFYGRMKELRRNGLTAVGLSGNQYKGRAYGVLTIDPHDRIVHAEKFAGWTVFANLKPVPEIEGLSLDELLTNEISLPISTKLQTAFINAAKDLQRARQEKLATTEEQPANTLQFA
jgi:DNA-binding transcriptional regulator of glucitol operon